MVWCGGSSPWMRAAQRRMRDSHRGAGPGQRHQGQISSPDLATLSVISRSVTAPMAVASRSALSDSAVRNSFWYSSSGWNSTGSDSA